MNLIDKSAVVAEIERRKKEEVNYDENGGFASWADNNYYSTLDSIQDFLNTLEVKDVDLNYIKEELDRLIKIQKPDGDFGWGTLYNVATHFFELGVKA